MIDWEKQNCGRVIITPRNIADCPEKPLNVDPHPDMMAKIYNIQIITPIFGGGVKASENDPVTPIRPSSIRGHLRFWWRATRGAKYPTVAELRQREGEIWGTTEEPSKVAIEIEIKNQWKKYPCAYFPEDKNFPRFEKNHPPYALFPFQGNKRDGIPPANCTSNVSFELKLNHPKNICYDIEAAVWGWTNFGGISARTRRGCGSLYCRELSPERKSISLWYELSLKAFGIEQSSTRDWPTLPYRFLVRDNNSSNTMQEWTDVVGIMQAFRQGPSIGRNPGSSPNRPGRSRFPEPESIRHATQKRSTRHAGMPAIPNDAFPRAELGLPIVFHFKDQREGDPGDTELYPIVNDQEKTRMSSPLILRSLVCKDGEVLQMIMRLNAPGPEKVVLKKTTGNPVFTKIQDPSLASYPNSPMGAPKAGAPVRSPSGSAIEGFLAFAKENGFIEVK